MFDYKEKFLNEENEREIMQPIFRFAKKYIFFALLVVFSAPIDGYAENIASCRDPAGKSNYFFFGGTSKRLSGWDDDKITGGIISLQLKNGELDLTFTDVRKRIYSARAEDGVVQLFRTAPDNFTVLVYYEQSTFEIYTFLKEKDGNLVMHQLQSKGGLNQIHKSSLLVAKCDHINFSRIGEMK